MKIRVGHSPDSDDAFMFYALAKNKIDTGRYEIVHEMQDIESLNQRALRGELEITAISLHAFPYVADKYALMTCGASIGDGYGPMLVSDKDGTVEDFRGKKIAIPGKLTTAYLTMKLLRGGGQQNESLRRLFAFLRVHSQLFNNVFFFPQRFP